MRGEGPAPAPVNVEEIKGSKKSGEDGGRKREASEGKLSRKKKRKKEEEIGLSLQITACKTGKLQIALALSIREFIR